MAGDKGIESRLFSTVPTKALFMPILTALDWRVLGLIALHDGMTLLKVASGKKMGAGCTASNLTLAREAQCSYAALCRSISKLEELSLIEKQDRRGGNGLTAIRVRYDQADNVPLGDVQNDEAATLNDHPATLNGGQYDQTVHFDGSKPAENCEERPSHYSPLRGELYVAEAKELNSVKLRKSNFSIGKDPAEAGQSRVSIWSQLPSNFDGLSPAARVSCIERAFAALGRNTRRIARDDVNQIRTLLCEIAVSHPGENYAQQAERLSLEFDS